MINIKSVDHAEAVAFGLEQVEDFRKGKPTSLELGQRGDDAVMLTVKGAAAETLCGFACHVDGGVRAYDELGSVLLRDPKWIETFDREAADLHGPDAAAPVGSLWQRLLRFVLPWRR